MEYGQERIRLDYLGETKDLLSGFEESFFDLERNPSDIEFGLFQEIAAITHSSLQKGSTTQASHSIAQVSQPSHTQDENIPVSLAQIEKLLNRVGELTVLQSVITQQCIQKDIFVPPLMRDTISAMSKVLKETHGLSMGLRKLPIRQTFQKMQKIARDSSRVVGKEVKIQLSGEGIEIDKTLLNSLSNLLAHLIQYAINHSLEDTHKRIRSGKSPTGHISLSAYDRAERVVIEVKDDGNGLDPEKLITQAKAKGMIPSDAPLSQVQIEIESQPQKGICIRILLPPTLAAMDSIVARSGDERYVIPLSQVSEFYCPNESEITSVYGQSELLTLRSETIAVFKLSSLINQTQFIQKESWKQTALIVTNCQGSKAAVMVDRIVAQQQVVMKPIGNEIKGNAGHMGFAILGDGKPALILDLLEMISPHSRNHSMLNREVV